MTESNMALANAGQTGTAVTVTQPRTQVDMWNSKDGFELAARMAKALCTSTLVPKHYRGDENLGSAMIALDLAQRLGISPLMVMQNMAPIEGRPAWSSKFLIAMINNSGRFSLLRFEMTEDPAPIDVEWVEYVWGGDKRPTPTKRVEKGVINKRCTAHATDLRTGEKVTGPEVSIKMAIQERWYHRNGSKWQTLPELMLQYRAGTMFAALYGADLTLGLPTQEEAEDALVATPSAAGVYSVDTTGGAGAAALSGIAAKAATMSAPEPTGESDDSQPGDASTAWPKTLPNGVMVDARGVPFIDGIHSGGKTCNSDGSWRRKKGVHPDHAATVEDTYRKNLEQSMKVAEAEPGADATAGTADPDPSAGGDDGPTFEDVMAWIKEEKDPAELDSLIAVANDTEMSEAQRAQVSQAINQRRSELSA